MDLYSILNFLVEALNNQINANQQKIILFLDFKYASLYLNKLKKIKKSNKLNHLNNLVLKKS